MDRWLITTIIIFLLANQTLMFSAAGERLAVKEVKRITHPYYSIGNIFYSHRQPFNLDDTKIWIYESSSYKHPDYGKYGRGLCWGNIEELKNWTSVSEYEKACKPFPDNNKISHPASLYWSNIEGEADIAYATFKDGWLKRINVSSEAPVWRNYSYLVPDGASPQELSIRCFGWDKYNHLVCGLDGENSNSAFGTENVKGWDIDIATRTKNPVTSWEDPLSSENKCGFNLWHGLYFRTHGHSDVYDGYASYYGSGQGYSGVWNLSACDFFPDPEYGPPYISHCDWDNSPEWFICDGNLYDYWRTEPNVQESSIVQRFFNVTTESFGERNDFYVKRTARPWTKIYDTFCSNDDDCGYKQYCDITENRCKKKIRNYHAGLLPKMSHNGRMIVFTATDGKFSKEDYDEYGKYHGWTSNDWDMIGLWLIEVGTQCRDSDSDGYNSSSCGGQDCDDSDPAVNPSAAEKCDGKDNDCDGQVDEGCPALRIAGASGIEVDGHREEGWRSPQITVSNSSVSDNRVEVSLLWDRENLYAFLNVTDNILSSQLRERDGKLWHDDSVEVFIDAEDNGGETMEEGDYHFIVNPNGSLYDSRGTGNPDSADDSSWNSSALVSVSLRQGGYVVELSIPWKDMGVSPEHGKRLRLLFTNNDRDEGGVKYVYNHEWPWQRPSLWTEVSLAHRADSSMDGCVDSGELASFIDLWLSGGDVSLKDLVGAVKIWMGC